MFLKFMSSFGNLKKKSNECQIRPKVSICDEEIKMHCQVPEIFSLSIRMYIPVLLSVEEDVQVAELETMHGASLLLRNYLPTRQLQLHLELIYLCAI